METQRRLAAAVLCGALLTTGCSHLASDWRMGRDTTGDATLVTKVKARLLDDPGTSAMDVRVAATQGTVRLSGNASREQSERAVEIAKSVPGVKQVDNQIQTPPNS
jgi:osmotically-inducible protein OsmY